MDKITSVLENLYYTVYNQNNSDIFTFPIKIDNTEYYLYQLDCIKCLLQELKLNNKKVEQNLSYKELIIRYAQYYNNNIKTYLSTFKHPGIFKLITVDEILLLTNYNLEELINYYRENNFKYRMRVYYYKLIAPGNIIYDISIL